ncbi:MAG: hypothetical protein Q4F84_08200 [Fibrobacter sp.]|nr:hypothetical protein [Fibrobacter sp.]
MKKHYFQQKSETANEIKNAPIDSYIPFLEGRPERKDTICRDDILDLLIAIHTCKSFEEFFHST